jgi:L-threonine kinase
MQAAVSLPATCGELVQGALDGVPALVSCPIARFSTARVQLDKPGISRAPENAPKAAAAVQAALSYRGRSDLGAILELDSDIPRGRGYGSSTADVAEAILAVGEALGQPFSPLEAAGLAVSIEPSDSTMFPGLALFDHRGASFYELLGPAPALTVLVCDPGGEVDTIAFNRQDHQATLKRLAHQHREAFDLLRRAVARGDAEMLGAAATLSARAHQAILYNPLLEEIIKLADDLGAPGVCRAHSGTLLGILLDPQQAMSADIGYLANRLAGQAKVTAYALVGGGNRIFQQSVIPRTADR